MFAKDVDMTGEELKGDEILYFERKGSRLFTGCVLSDPRAAHRSPVDHRC